jgi:hypothetical protein
MEGAPDANIQSFLERRQRILAIRDLDSLEGKELQAGPLEVADPLLTARTESARKRNQGKLLLVALLENYCMLYDQSKEQNQQLFFTLCAYLAKMGIIESTDFLDEFSSVRSSYKRAFKELVLKALQTVKDMNGSTEVNPVITHLDNNTELPLVPSPNLGNRLNLPSITSIPSDITEMLDSSTSRFEEEFESKIFFAQPSGTSGGKRCFRPGTAC